MLMSALDILSNRSGANPIKNYLQNDHHLSKFFTYVIYVSFYRKATVIPITVAREQRNGGKILFWLAPTLSKLLNIKNFKNLLSKEFI